MRILLNLPNLITCLRVILVPVVLWCVFMDYFGFAAFLFIFAGLSDALDGVLARRWGQCTSFGSWLDPVADKIMLDSLYILLGFGGYIPFWLVFLVLGRDILIMLFVGFTMLGGFSLRASPTRLGKICTLLQIIHIAALLISLSIFGFPFPYVLDIVFLFYIYLLLLIILCSGFEYFLIWFRFMFPHITFGSGRSRHEGDR